MVLPPVHPTCHPGETMAFQGDSPHTLSWTTKFSEEPPYSVLTTWALHRCCKHRSPQSVTAVGKANIPVLYRLPTSCHLSLVFYTTSHYMEVTYTYVCSV